MRKNSDVQKSQQSSCRQLCKIKRVHLKNKDYRNAEVMLLLLFQWKTLQFKNYIPINVSTEYFAKLIGNYRTTYTT